MYVNITRGKYSLEVRLVYIDRGRKSKVMLQASYMTINALQGFIYTHVQTYIYTQLADGLVSMCTCDRCMHENLRLHLLARLYLCVNVHCPSLLFQ